jgi:hypothetical protein
MFMKKVFYTVLLLTIFSLMQSCNKDHNFETKQIVIDTTLASGATYDLNLQPYGDADDVASIVKQAANYTTSEITNTTGTFAPVYHYSAFTKTGVTDQVVLSVAEGAGHRHHSDSTLITINFTIK